MSFTYLNYYNYTKNIGDIDNNVVNCLKNINTTNNMAESIIIELGSIPIVY